MTKPNEIKLSDDPKDWITRSRVLLSGHLTETKNGLIAKRYLPEQEEEEYRLALAVILSTGKLPKEICQLLAAVIAPSWSCIAGERTVRFGFRRRGPRRDGFRDTQIAQRVVEKVRSGSRAGKAITEVAEELGMSDANVSVIWKRFKPFRDAGVM